MNSPESSTSSNPGGLTGAVLIANLAILSKLESCISTFARLSCRILIPWVSRIDFASRNLSGFSVMNQTVLLSDSKVAASSAYLTSFPPGRTSDFLAHGLFVSTNDVVQHG